MIVGDLLFVMSGSPYFGPPLARATLVATFGVQISNRTGSSTIQVDVEHRNRDDTSWSVAANVVTTSANGVYANQISGLKELVRYKFTFTAGAATDGMYVIAAFPQWLLD